MSCDPGLFELSKGSSIESKGESFNVVLGISLPSRTPILFLLAYSTYITNTSKVNP